MAEVRTSITGLWRDVLRLTPMDVEARPDAGGKLLRPALCLLSAAATGATDLRKYVNLAMAYEALHVASLAHDDVVDRALLRRGSASLNALWNDHAAVLGGDYLVARAIEILAHYESCEVITDALSTIRRMAEGELHFFGRDPKTVAEEDCLMLAECKTASLFAVACAGPAHLEGSDFARGLSSFGNNLGIAFQLVDDLLDVTQTSAQLGKPSCGDVEEGKQTLPLLALKKALDKEGLEHFERLHGADLSDEDRAWIMGAMESTGARDIAVARARAFGNDALEELDVLPPSVYRDSMEGIVEFVLVRIS